MKKAFKQFKRVPLTFWIIYFVTIILVTIFNLMLFSSFRTELDQVQNQPILPKDSACNCRKCDPENKILYSDVDEITYISVPRPLSKDKQKRSMKIAISSWLASSPKSRVLLFINRTEFDKTDKFPQELENIFGPNRVIYAGGIRTDLKGVPYINEWFIQGILHSPSKYICFINSDIIVSAKWLKRVKQIFAIDKLEDKPLVLIGQRIDFDLKEQAFNTISFINTFDENNESTLLHQIDKIVFSSSHNDHSPYGIDSFTFRKDKLPFDPYLIPPFIMGRYNWDNWIVGWLNKICDTVTFNLDPPIYHVNHVRHSFDVNDSRVAINHHLKQANKNYFGSNYDTKWEVNNNQLRQRRGSIVYYLDQL